MMKIHDLLGFLLYLNDKKLINNHDFDFEEEAARYISSLELYQASEMMESRARKATELLQKIIDYRKGNGQYDFSSYCPPERTEIAADSYKAIIGEIRQFLRENNIKTSPPHQSNT